MNLCNFFICFLCDNIICWIKYFVSFIFFILVVNIVKMLFGFIELIKLRFEFVFKNLGEKFVNGLNSKVFLLFIYFVFRWGIDIGGVLILVLLYIFVWCCFIIFWFLYIINSLFIGNLLICFDLGILVFWSRGRLLLLLLIKMNLVVWCLILLLFILCIFIFYKLFFVCLIFLILCL